MQARNFESAKTDNAREERHRLVQREFSLVVISGQLRPRLWMSLLATIQRHILDFHFAVHKSRATFAGFLRKEESKGQNRER